MKIFKNTVVTLLLALLLAPDVCVAKKYSPFLDLEGQYVWYSFYGVAAGGISGGYRWDEYGIELGYVKPENETWRVGDITTIYHKSNNYYVDGLRFFKLNRNIDLKGRLGVGYFTTKTNDTASYLDQTDRALGARAGIGIHYNLYDNFSIGIGYTIQYNPNIILHCLNSLSLGFAYYL